jgi:uncharacterized membrane protein
MTAAHADDIIEGYIARLQVALDDADSATAAEVLGGVRSHIAEARAILVDESDADILNLLDRLGEPSILAAEAAGSPRLAAEAAGSSRQPAAPPAPNTIPPSAMVALALLLVGAVVSLILGPFSLILDAALLIIALWFARTSGRWEDHEISIAGLVPVLFLTAVILLVAFLAAQGQGHLWILVLLVGPSTSLVASAAYLSWTASRRSRRLS